MKEFQEKKEGTVLFPPCISASMCAKFKNSEQTSFLSLWPPCCSENVLSKPMTPGNKIRIR